MRTAVAALLILCLTACLTPASVQAAATPAERCPAGSAFTTPARHLDHLARAIAAAGAIDVLAVGSASSSGQDSSGDSAFPRRMATAMRAALPNIELKLTVRGGIVMTAAEMLPLIGAALAEQPFQLVIWQTGTVEAVHGSPPAALRATLENGAALVYRAGADLVLVGPQFSRVLASKSDLAPYQGALQAAAARPGTVLFDRFDLTRGWAQDGFVDLERAAKADRRFVLETLHACVGAALAQFVLTGAVIGAEREGQP